MDNAGRRKVAYAVASIRKLAGAPGDFLAEAKRGGDWTHQEMYRAINNRAKDIEDELVRAGILIRE